MIEDFADKFRKLSEDSAQKRAEESRKLKKVEDKFNEQAANLNNLNTSIDEIAKKKKQNG